MTREEHAIRDSAREAEQMSRDRLAEDLRPNWREAMWDLYWHVFHDYPRKDTLRLMIGHGLTARQAIREMRDYERSGDRA